jgi:hypothetical protein
MARLTAPTGTHAQALGPPAAHTVQDMLGRRWAPHERSKAVCALSCWVVLCSVVCARIRPPQVGCTGRKASSTHMINIISITHGVSVPGHPTPTTNKGQASHARKARQPEELHGAQVLVQLPAADRVEERTAAGNGIHVRPPVPTVLAVHEQPHHPPPPVRGERGGAGRGWESLHWAKICNQQRYIHIYIHTYINMYL